MAKPNRVTIVEAHQVLADDTVYVGNGTQWGNIFRPGQRSILVYDAGLSVSTKVVTPKDQAECLSLYQKRLEFMLKHDLTTKRDLALLKGKRLASWDPAGQRCHVDILLEMVNG